jgi:hypothetical protein
MNETAIILMDLKYCEQCGGLWLRRKTSDEVLCRGCRCAVARIPEAWRGAAGRKRPCQRVRAWFEARWKPLQAGGSRRPRTRRGWNRSSLAASGRVQ